MPELEVEDIELDLLLSALVRRYGYDFRNYARASLKRRVAKAVEAEGLLTISALQERVLHSPAAMERFISNLTVRLTSMFRDPEFFLTLRREVLPMLRTFPIIRVWHAGCASGEEAFSTAILLIEEGLYSRSRIYATDMSGALIGSANAGVVSLAHMKENTANYHASGGVGDFSDYYVADDKHALFHSAVRKNLVFSQHNLASDSAFNEFHLVLCRNVLIYFDGVLRERVHKLIYSSLAHLGVLGLGLQEALVDTTVASRYRQLFKPELKLFQKIA
ncbi:MAG: protein-glutamate O-methyltransferase CheR [Polyangiaceae bacterium]|nr:protein-glutamate O-methyltransferase CheR [Polyangiaceae bacterium]